MPRYTLDFEAPDHDAAIAALSAIGDDAWGDQGEVLVDGRLIRWELTEQGERGGIEVDRRQRLAAALLVMGFNLPQEMGAASRSMLEAARLCPGMTTGDIGDMGSDTRRVMLERARGLIDEMLAEARTSTALSDGSAPS